MAITDRQNPSEEKKKNLFRLFPFLQRRTTTSSSPSSTQNQPGRHRNRNTDVSSRPPPCLSLPWRDRFSRSTSSPTRSFQLSLFPLYV
ncbi:hypothetical protein Bca52824_051794 [Brassica carinata]|uniref:Uncharacterized protein n=1 Tax=Brassica carinata TaxID=52824 RepID=A0A8X7UJ82_BRACI|nr:hypothetical protein Bca52824_051794 [Brassica carinata]